MTPRPPISKRERRTLITRPGCAPFFRYRRTQPGGMTLVELLVVVALIGVLSAVVIVRIGPWSIGNPGARAVARRLALDLRHARVLAIAEGTNHYLGFDADGTTLLGYTIYRTASPTDIPVETYRTFDSGVAATSATTRAEFMPTGAALGAYTCVVSGSTKNYTVTVIAATGTTTVSAP
ncbi:MAG: GspH/FimT family pseudopilin [Phycisphaerae bacterium]